jgi:hypothetical protein
VFSPVFNLFVVAHLFIQTQPVGTTFGVQPRLLRTTLFVLKVHQAPGLITLYHSTFHQFSSIFVAHNDIGQFIFNQYDTNLVVPIVNGWSPCILHQYIAPLIIWFAPVPGWMNGL